ncbi:MAG TPA: M50 family metallopeptidase [Thermoanaerobaculia bacterium]
MPSLDLCYLLSAICCLLSSVRMLHLGSIGGTSIDIDFSFFLLIFFFAIQSYDQGLAHALVWAPVIFVSILFHELAHAAMIGIFGFGSSHIVLGGMGGVTINERRARPWQDMLISVAGPISSFLLALICFQVELRVPRAHTDPMLVAFLPLMVWVGVVWGILNFMPVPPLDGGRALRNLLRTFLRENVAFMISIWIAFLFGALAIAYGLWTKDYFIAVLFAWFTFNNFQQWQEYRHRGFPGD